MALRLDTVITGRTEYNTATHRSRLIPVFIDTGIRYKIIDSILQDFANRTSGDIPTVRTDYGSVVGSVFDAGSRIAVIERTTHDAYPVVRTVTAGNSANTHAIIVLGCQYTGNMGTVIILIYRPIIRKTVDGVRSDSMPVALITVAVIVSPGVLVIFSGILPKIVFQIFMVNINLRIHHIYNHFRLSFFNLPGFQNTDIPACQHPVAAVIIEVPLLGQIRVIIR